VEMSVNGGDGRDRSDGWWLSGSHMPVFLPYIHVYICNTKIFYNTMKYKKIVFLNFYASTVNIYDGFLCHIKIIYMGLGFI